LINVQSIDAMSRLLNALLDISKPDSGAVKPNPSDFCVKALFAVRGVGARFRSLAAGRGLNI
jgi:two-component system, sensor histidine kinase